MPAIIILLWSVPVVLLIKTSINLIGGDAAVSKVFIAK